MKALITGGAGFIGSAIARALIAQGHEVRIFDNLETGSLDNVPPQATFTRGDVRDLAALEAAAAGAEVIAHMAAMVSVPLSVAEPGRCYEVNVLGTRNALEAAMRVGARRVVMASSAAVYGNDPTLPKRESLPQASASPYAYSKWLNEVDAEYYSRWRGLETVCLRYFNVYGPRQRPDSPYSGVISIAADRLLANQPFTVFGTGEQTRDFVYVEDVAEAVAAAATRAGLRHEVINVGAGEQTTLLTLVATMGRILGQEPRLEFAPPRAGDVLHSVADVSRLAERLGYRAHTSLESGLANTLDWMKSARAIEQGSQRR